MDYEIGRRRHERFYQKLKYLIQKKYSENEKSVRSKRLIETAFNSELVK